MMVFPDKEQVTWTICHLLSISTLQCHYIKSIATINFSNLTFTKLYAHGTNYHLVKKNVLCNWYFIRAVHHWNLLPDECGEIPTSAQFRSAIMEYLWSLIKKCCNELNNDTSPIEREPD